MAEPPEVRLFLDIRDVKSSKKKNAPSESETTKEKVKGLYHKL